MEGRVLADDEVRRPVVSLVLVDVVDLIPSVQFPAKCRFGYDAMLERLP